MNFTRSNRSGASILLAAAMALTGSGAGAVDTLSIAFGSTVASHIKNLKDGFEAKSGYNLDSLKDEGMGSDSVVVAVDSGKVDVGIIGSPYEEVLKVAQEKKLEIKNLEKIKTKVVGRDKVIFVTYKGGPKELTNAQIKSVLTGAVRNWKEIGFDDAPVLIAVQTNSPVTQKLISSQLLDGQDFHRRGIKILRTYEELAKFVGSTKGAIGFGPPSMQGPEVNVLAKPEIFKPFIALTIGEPNVKAAKLIDYMLANQPK